VAAAEPALQGAFAGQLGRSGGVGQADADVTGSPGGVLLTQSQSQRVEGVTVVRRTSGARSVGGLKQLGLTSETLYQIADRAGAEVQLPGDGRSVTAGLRQTKDAFTDGQWD
jgi:hypothetical protein